MARKVEEVVEELAKPIIASQKLELVDVEYNKEGQNWILRIFIDGEDGISLDDCQQVSQALSDQLDVEDPIEKSYLLEVSSPGIDRPLKSKKDFERFAGRKIDISTYAPVNGEKSLTGKLLGLEEDSIKIDLEGEIILVPRSKVAQTRLSVDF